MSNISEHVSIGEGFLLNKESIDILVDPKANLPEDASPEDVQLEVLKVLDPQNGAVAGLQGGGAAVGVQRETESSRVGVYANTDGSVKATGEYNVSKPLGDENSGYEFTTSGRLQFSSDPSQNEAKITGGITYSNSEVVKGEWALDNYSVSVGAGTKGGPIENNLDLKGGVTAGIEWSNQTTDIFLGAAAQTSSDGTDVTYEAGIRRDLTGELSVDVYGTPMDVGRVQAEAKVQYSDNGDYSVTVGPTIGFR